MSEKLIRDPVHDCIAFRMERETDALLFRLLNAVELQRLRRIRQLGLASLAYPGADHSRYSHSLGVMETARKIISQLGQSYYISEEDRIVCYCAALLHDLGHGPFSHVFERVSGVHHERITHALILDPHCEVHQILRDHATDLPERIVALLDGRDPPTFLSDVLSSQLDSDRLDYLLRDNLMTGSQYGGYDLRWLIHALTVDERTRRLVITWKGVSAVEAYLQSRSHMYRNVYFHKVVRSAEGMVKLALQRARRMAVQGRLSWPPAEHPVTKGLLGRTLSAEEFNDLDDVAMLHCFKSWAGGDDATLAGLCHGLLFRQVFKTIDLTHVPGAEQIAQRVREEIQSAGGLPEYQMFFDEPSDLPYEIGDSSREILVRDPDGRLTELSKRSPMPAAMNQQVRFRRIHVAEQWKDLAKRVVVEVGESV
ncbi:MAG: HD domain-containing protein [Phycisphaerae bacterium]|nr:HD domain-containing protein [Phycisphaerae bacterium]